MKYCKFYASISKSNTEMIDDLITKEEKVIESVWSDAVSRALTCKGVYVYTYVSPSELNRDKDWMAIVGEITMYFTGWSQTNDFEEYKVAVKEIFNSVLSRINPSSFELHFVEE